MDQHLNPHCSSIPAGYWSPWGSFGEPIQPQLAAAVQPLWAAQQHPANLPPAWGAGGTLLPPFPQPGQNQVAFCPAFVAEMVLNIS